jgi:peroxiredoxin
MIDPGTPAPPFSLPLVGGGTATRERLLEGGRPALLVFFKNECPTCRLSMPFLQRMYERLSDGPSPAGFLAIAQNEPLEMPDFLAKYGVRFQVALDRDPWQVSFAYDVTNVPSLFLIDEHGIVLSADMGFAKKAFDRILGDLASRTRTAAPESLFTNADAGVPALQPG